MKSSRGSRFPALPEMLERLQEKLDDSSGSKARQNKDLEHTPASIAVK
jgi:hypothetical protein